MYFFTILLVLYIWAASFLSFQFPCAFTFYFQSFSWLAGFLVFLLLYCWFCLYGQHGFMFKKFHLPTRKSFVINIDSAKLQRCILKTCSGPNMPSLLTSSRVNVLCMLTFSCSNVSYMLTCLNATCVVCLCAQVLTCFACLHVQVSTCFACSCPHVPKCQHVLGA